MAPRRTPEGFNPIQEEEQEQQEQRETPGKEKGGRTEVREKGYLPPVVELIADESDRNNLEIIAQRAIDVKEKTDEINVSIGISGFNEQGNNFVYARVFVDAGAQVSEIVEQLKREMKSGERQYKVKTNKPSPKLKPGDDNKGLVDFVYKEAHPSINDLEKRWNEKPEVTIKRIAGEITEIAKATGQEIYFELGPARFLRARPDLSAEQVIEADKNRPRQIVELTTQGKGLQEIANEMVRIAQAGDIDVQADFNGVELTASPQSKPKEIIASFKEKQKPVDTKSVITKQRPGSGTESLRFMNQDRLDLSQVAAQLQLIARKTGRNVETMFNGIPIEATPTTFNVDDITSGYRIEKRTQEMLRTKRATVGKGRKPKA